MAGRSADSRRPVYKLKDFEGEEVKGVWYPEEIQPITANEYRIERVIKRRRGANGKKNCLSSGSVGLRSLTRGLQSRLNTMSAPIDDEFFITLLSNATQGSPTGNRPSRYETRLAHPLRLDGVWEAALINYT